uniref:Protein asunder n=1 Tax=Parastrongyloides trichosuri TaxID=131310 RepID=A0A0N4Z0A7_PARTI
MSKIDFVENYTHKILIIINNTPSFNVLTKLVDKYIFKNGTEELSFQRHLFSIIKEMIFEIQRVLVDLYNDGDKFLNVIATDTMITQQNVSWINDSMVFSKLQNTLESIKLMEDDSKCREMLYSNVTKSIDALAKPTPTQIKFAKLFNKETCGKEDSTKKKHPKWWKVGNDYIDEDINTPLINMGSLIVITHNFDDKQCLNLYEHTKKSIIKNRQKTKGFSKLDHSRLIIINAINEDPTLFKKYYIHDEKSNVHLDRYDIHFNDNSSATISSLLREIFNLSSFTMTNIPMKDESLNSKLCANVEMYHPMVFLPFEKMQKFIQNKESLAHSKMQYESINIIENRKEQKNYTTNKAAWNSAPKRTPLLQQSLPYTVSDFSSREGSCTNGFILGGKDIFPELITKDSNIKGVDLAFSLSKNFDKSYAQINILDEALYSSKTMNDSNTTPKGDPRIVLKMTEIIDNCLSSVEKTDTPGLTIDEDLLKARVVNPIQKVFISTESKDCFRSDLSKIIKILSRTDYVDSTYPYLKALIEKVAITGDDWKCILDVISNFRYVSKSHELLYKSFCDYYFDDYLPLGGLTTPVIPRCNINDKNNTKILRSTNKNMIDRFIKRYDDDEKPEFEAWRNPDNNGKSVIPLYPHLKEKSNGDDDKEVRPLFESKYYAPDPDETLLSVYGHYSPILCDDYLKVAPPPYFGGCITYPIHEKKKIDYKTLVTFITNPALPKEKRILIEKESEKLRINYVKPVSSTVPSIVHPDSRKRRNLEDINDRSIKLARVYNTPTHQGGLTLAKQDTMMIEKMKEEIRNNLKVFKQGMSKNKGNKKNKNHNNDKNGEKKIVEEPIKEEIPSPPSKVEKQFDSGTESITTTPSHEHGEECVNNGCGEEKLVQIKISLPNNASFEATLSPKEPSIELFQVISERDDCCFRTCYQLYAKGVRLDTFTELEKLVTLEDGDTVEFIQSDYSTRDARDHVRRICDILNINDISTYVLNKNGASFNYLGHMKTNFDPDSKEARILATPQDYVLPGNKDINYSHLVPDISDKQIKAFNFIGISPFNPPTPQRKLKGDVLYVIVETLEGKSFNITCSFKGWFVNSTSGYKFNPEPMPQNPSVFHELPDLLMTLSLGFKKMWPKALKARSDMHVFEKLEATFPSFNWVVPSFEATQDYFRAEDETQIQKTGFEELLPGGLRDWNEELCNGKDMPKKEFREKLDKDRLFYKSYSDFVKVAVKGAMAIIDGNVPSLNMSDDFKTQMFLYNSIFFSLGYDSKDHYVNFGGNAAAHAITNNDLKGARAFHSLDKDGLYNLGLCLVDYKGYRIVCQSIVPGILEREQDAEVNYGSVDFGKTVRCDEIFSKPLEEVAKEMNSMPHTVITFDEEGKEIKTRVFTSIETKGLVGKDGRKYVLDLFRTFPPDPNYIKDAIVTDLCKANNFPKFCEHVVPCLRPELVELFITKRTEHFFSGLQTAMYENEILKDSGIGYSEILEKLTRNESLNTEEQTNEARRLFKEYLLKIGSCSDEVIDIRFNNDCYYPGIKFDETVDDIESHKKLLAEAGEFLIATAIPEFFKDIFKTNPSSTPMDGYILTCNMHAKGINMRYLGHMAMLIEEIEKHRLIYELFVGEILSRTIKHIFRKYTTDLPRCFTGTAIVHFLNCVFGNVESYDNKKVSKAKKGKKRSNSVDNNDSQAWKELTTAEVWKNIAEDSKKSFDFSLIYKNFEDFNKHINVKKNTVVRRFAKMVGLQFVAKTLKIDGKKLPFNEDDLYNMVPVVKHLEPHAKDAFHFQKVGEALVLEGKIEESQQYISESLQYMNYVYSGLHHDMSSSLKLIARLDYISSNPNSAYLNLQKSITITERVCGLDYLFLIPDYITISLYAFSAKDVGAALQYLYRARYLASVTLSDHHPILATIDGSLSIILYFNLDYDNSGKYFESFMDTIEKIKNKYSEKDSIDLNIKVALICRLAASSYAIRGLFREAIKTEKIVYQIYLSFFDKNHQKVLESGQILKEYTEKAVNLQRKLNDAHGNASDIKLGDLITHDIREVTHEKIVGFLNAINGVYFLTKDAVNEINARNAKENLGLNDSNIEVKGEDLKELLDEAELD